MFAGTIRSNLDPFGEHDDDALARALERASLPQLARDLGAKVEAFGGNLSLGVQQLVCLARAMLNPSRVLLLDEATAALDLASDAMVQRVLRTEFADRTVVTIAHRLDTIIDSDRVLIMDQGKVAEFAPPHELLASPDSIFSQLCRQTGGQYEQLRAAAQRHHETMLALQARLAAADLAAREAGDEAARAGAHEPPAVVVKVAVV